MLSASGDQALARGPRWGHGIRRSRVGTSTLHEEVFLWPFGLIFFVQKYYLFSVTRCVFLAVNTSKMRLRSPRWGTYSAPPDLVSLPKSSTPLSALRALTHGGTCSPWAVPPRFSGLERYLIMDDTWLHTKQAFGDSLKYTLVYSSTLHSSYSMHDWTITTVCKQSGHVCGGGVPIQTPAWASPDCFIPPVHGMLE